MKPNAPQDELPRTYDYVFVHHHEADNVGDRECSPHRFLRFPNRAVRRFRQKLPQGKTLVVGGGGVFEEVRRTAQSPEFDAFATRIAWGVGLPVRGSRDDLVRRLVSRFDAFGTRDYGWRNEVDFVPCASCLYPGFDAHLATPPRHEAVLYLHRSKTDFPAFEESGLPMLTNQARDLGEVIAFLASGETVVTNSYHGVYWSQLLGRRVLCLPYGDKFAHLEHAPSLSTPETWRRDIAGASKYESPLERYRTLNLTFMDRAFGLEATE